MIWEDALLGREEYKQHARQLAKKHGLISESEMRIEAVILECETQFENIRQVYKELNSDHEYKRKGSKRNIPAATLLIENFYIILSKMNEVKSVMNGSGIHTLPERLNRITSDMVAHSDCSIDKNKIFEFISAYQEVVHLTADELWWLGAMLKVQLINRISAIGNAVYEVKRQRDMAERLGNIRNVGKIISRDPRRESSLIEHFACRMKTDRDAYIKFKETVDLKYEALDLTLDDLIRFENELQNALQVSLGNAVNSLRQLDCIDFQELFEKLSHLEHILQQDPAGVYGKMDDYSKDYYRKQVVKIAKKERVSEFFVAKKALEKAREENQHIGTYIISNNRDQSKEIMSYKAAILSASLVSTFFLTVYAFTRGSALGWIQAVLACLLTLPVTLEIFTQIVQRSFTNFLTPVTLPRLDLEEGIPKEYAVMIIIPTLLSSEQRVEELCRHLESLYAVNGGENVYFAIVGDLADAEQEVLETDAAIAQKGREEIAALNARYGEGIFYFYLRERVYNEKQNRWLGRERKRGAILDFNQYLKEDPGMPKIRYVITLDADTKLTIGAVNQLVGTAAHPLNRPVVDWETGCVKAGYGVLQTAIATEITSTRKSLFTKIFAGQGGMDTYSVKVSDLYMDMCGEGIYTGKGIYDLDIFNALLQDTLPDNLVLSHDLLEGSYLRTGFVNDMQMIDAFPAKYNSYAMRQHRWVRGDWQIIRWLGRRVRNRKGEYVRNPLNATSKWKIYDNLRRSWVDPALFLLLLFGAFILPGKQLLWILLVLAAIFALPTVSVVEAVVNLFHNPQNKRYFTFSHVLSGLQAVWLQRIINVSFLPFSACLMIGAVCKTVYRLIVTKRKMLEWVTAADMETILKGDLKSYLLFMKACPIAGVLLFFSGNFLLYGIGILWILGPVIAWYISKPIEKPDRKAELSQEDLDSLQEDAKRMWKFYENFVVPLDHYLPPDNVQFDPVFNVAHRTSPTNIGFYLMAVIAASDMEWIQPEEAAERIEHTISTLERMEKWNGHLYNWYDTMSLLPLRPYYVSTVDSGNLQGYLLTVAVALRERGDACQELAQRCETLAEEMDFTPLYDKSRNLFSIGFNIEDGRLSPSHYDLLVSEARQTSFIALANRTVPEKHWKHLGRRPVTIKGHVGLASWTGTAFEFLMPNLIMKSYESSLLDEALQTCVLAQMEYVKARTRPWGISESGFYEFDLNLNYQYKAFGIPRLGLKKGLGEEFVVAPYGSILALPLVPEKVMENLKIIKALGAYGEYGYYEAIDYTAARTGGEKYKIVKSYMAHHLGMSFIAIHNYLFDNLMKRRFHSIPYIKGAEYLLSERVPISGTPQNDTVMGENRVRVNSQEQETVQPAQKVTAGVPARNRMPACGLISNGRYSLFINSLGVGYSKLQDKLLAAWNFDGMEYSGGFYCCVKLVDSGLAFTTTALPERELPAKDRVALRKPDKYEFSAGGEILSFTRWDEQLETVTDITVATEDNAEVRRTRIVNHGNSELILEICGGISFALAPAADYMAHPVYNNLFITSEFVPEGDLVVAAKKPREEGKPYIYGFCAFPVNRGRRGAESIGDLHCEAEGEKIFLKRRVKVEPGETLEFNFIFGITESREEAVKLADRYDDFPNADRAFELSRLKCRNEIEEFALDLLPHLFYQSSVKYYFMDEIRQCNVHRSALWTFGISLDHPVIVSFIDASHGEEWVEKLLETVRFYQMKGLQCDLVFVAQEPAGYMQPVYEMLLRVAGGGRATVLRGSELTEELRRGLLAFASMIFNEEIYDVRRFDRIPSILGEQEKKTPTQGRAVLEDRTERMDLSRFGERLFDNGVGFFTKTPEEYIIYGTPPAPWINVIASPEFGFTVDSEGQGCTWADNSRENRLTPWNNSIYHRFISENICVENLDTGEVRGLLNDAVSHITRHGIGYTIFEFFLTGMEIVLKMTCDFERAVKLISVSLRNQSEETLRLRIHYELQPVIGVSPIKTFRHLVKEDVSGGCIIRNVLPENEYGSYENLLFYTRNRELTVHSGSSGEVQLVMGKARSREEALEILAPERYHCQQTAEDYYRQMLAKVQVRTGEDAFDLIFGGRMIYQTLSCRMFGRTAFYQSGGAFGYRDQLQDSLAMIAYDSRLTREQILRCCRHQFREGDVQHWWHEPDGKGIRSRYSDDLLWLPYVVSEYIKGTGDWELMSLCEPFLESPLLGEQEKERYESPVVSDEKGSVYVHCVRAIDHALRFGTHGLPLMGGGDWNDGMNEVGSNDSGESVWLAWFLVSVLNRFIDVAAYFQDTGHIEQYTAEIRRLLSVIDTQAYDGAWYKRAYFHSGEPLGSAVCSECAIDSISQSWGAIAISEILESEARRGVTLLSEDLKETYLEHLVKAMDSVDSYLVDYRLGVVKLLTPPFVKSHPNPGYIMGYVAGVRENGGQYTHAAVWYVKGLLCMGKLFPERKEAYLERAKRILDLLNPVNHARTPLEVSVYRVEPYAVAADVYADPEGRIAGRGGWTWYTGAAGWMQQIAEELAQQLQ